MSAEIINWAKDTIETEIEALQSLKQNLDGEFATAVEAILSSKGKVIFTGMGKSGLISKKIAATLASTGTPSFFLHPAEAFHGDLGMISKEDIILAASYSGESDEVLKIIPFIHSNGNTLIAMTGNANSTLAKNSNIHLNIAVGHEACILNLAPTSSTTAQLVMGDALAIALMKLRNFTSVDFARLHPGGSLGRRLLMTVGNVMRSNDLPVAPPSCSAKDMIHIMSRGGLGQVVVCDEQQKVVGIVTDGDIRRAMEQREAEFFKISAADIATRHPITIAANEKLITAEKLMTKRKVNSLLVTNEENLLEGIIQIYDIKL
ncbi:MAG: KpsF/GutQ family sugar-phosphate isomerase [Rikenellaceae bacterium]